MTRGRPAFTPAERAFRARRRRELLARKARVRESEAIEATEAMRAALKAIISAFHLYRGSLAGIAPEIHAAIKLAKAAIAKAGNGK